MRTKKLNVYNKDPKDGVDNFYPTPPAAFKEPQLHLVLGVRGSGKSFLISKMLNQAQKDDTYDKIYLISPSYNSNRAYWEDHIDPEQDVYEPTKDSINKVIKRVEADRDEWEEYLEDKKMYKKYEKMEKEGKPLHHVPDRDIIGFYDRGFMTGAKPEWKYDNGEQPARSLLILDDVIGSDAIKRSSGLNRIATLNRHIAPLKETWKGRSAAALSTIISSQTYRMDSGIGRVLRENLSLLTMARNKQEKQMQ